MLISIEFKISQYLTRIFVFEVERFHVKSAMKSAGILHPIKIQVNLISDLNAFLFFSKPEKLNLNLPHGGAVEMDHHPFGRVECNRVGKFDTVKPVTKFRTEESCSGVSGIDVKPNIFRAT